MRIIQKHITKNQAYIQNVQKADSRYALFQTRGPLGAVLHSVGAAQPSALATVNYFNSPSVEACAHAALQADGTVYQMAPWNYRLWHVGGAANDTHIGVEMAEPGTDAICYDKSYHLHIVDREKALAFVKKTYETAVELFASLCIEYGWDPLEDGVILSHSEAHARGLGSGHTDPEHLWNAVGCGYSMDTFREAVAKTMLKDMEEEEMRYNKMKDVTSKEYRKTLDKLVEKGYLAGREGEGEERIIDLSEDTVRVLVMLDRAGQFGE